jgi:DNA-directed RNA polymerase specialized sigma subunit
VIRLYKWLKDYQKLKDEIAYLEFELNRYKRELKRWTYGDLQDVKLEEKSIASRLEEKIAEVEYELAHKENDLYDMKKLIKTFKGLDHKILYGKYVEEKTLEQIAEELNYSASYIYKRHAEIMRMIKFAKEVSL